MTLEKFRKKKHQIWRSYKEEILVTNFNSGSKRENELYMCFFHLTRYKTIRLQMDACHKRNDGAVVSATICRGKFQVRFMRPHFFFLWLFGLHKIFIAHGLHKPRFGALEGRSTLVLVTPVRVPNCASIFSN